MRMIDANSAKEALECTLVGDAAALAQRVIDRMPTIEAVPVVRCRECKHGSSGVLDVNCYHPEYDLCEGVTPHEPEFFCAYGEKREDGAE